MPTIAANTYRLPITEKLLRGQLIISKSTDSPAVPGNEAGVARLAAAQAALDAAVNGLASLTESITGGVPVAIVGTGFDIRSRRSSKQSLEPVVEVNVAYSDRPGYSDLTWKPQPNTRVYRIQCCSERNPESATWNDSGFSTEAKFTTNGATPGQICWYRIAAINSLGQGAWSDPALRPVM